MYRLGNFTIILPSYKCDRNCPFCIAKNNRKFEGFEDLNFDELEKAFEEFRQNGIHFERVVLSGNGEPSLYNYEQLKIYAGIFKANSDIFNVLRIHTSGNIFFDKPKFDLFNQLCLDVEFDTLRLSVDSEKDMQLLGYKRDYTKTEEFHKAKKIKFDIGLTKFLEPQDANSPSFAEDLDSLLKSYNNIKTIRFKNLMSGEHKESEQSKWVKETRMSKETFMEFSKDILSFYHCNSVNKLNLESGQVIKFENSGNYPKDVVFSKGLVCDYSEKPVYLSDLIKMSYTVDNTNPIEYDVLGG